MNDPLVLTWGNAHSLTIRFDDGMAPMAMFDVVKGDITQKMTILLPPEITRQHVEKAWAAQNNQWDELRVEDKKRKKRFTALRVIWLPETGHCLQWNVLHIGGWPYDTFGCTHLAKHVWNTAK